MVTGPPYKNAVMNKAHLSKWSGGVTFSSRFILLGIDFGVDINYLCLLGTA